ncbi:putative nuclease PA3 [Myriangium duriaei CBS 260.36]|uniref:Nuclease PA3 n=1 Tax=Myriangium duriaei CBS 260.36 TaxID=1168546 RepID=A0A9P4MK77_9PEZI|nr:putative nuclease PA3 [Myriangium duriaei CBS 260.36]
MRPTTAAPLLALLPTTFAWGELGHATVAYMAQSLVATKTTTWAQGILGDTSDSYMASIASWADSFRYTSAGKFSAPFHFVDAQDSPPSSCNVDYARDCTDAGCIISAMANYTQRVSNTQISKAEQENALRFIIHFVGDSHQPLHNENYKLGGNGVDVTYSSKDTNLHSIWDTAMPEQINGKKTYKLADAQTWATELLTEIKSGVYKSQSGSWTSSVNANDVIGTVTAWSSEANAFVCSVVAPKGFDVLTSGDLSEDYYNSVVPTIELQIARAGVRLAALLDQLSGAKTAPAASEKVVLAERDILPPSRPLTLAQKQRRAADYECGCEDHAH